MGGGIWGRENMGTNMGTDGTFTDFHSSKHLEPFRLSPVSLAHDNHQDSNLLFRLRQLRNNLSNFIEYLVPALHLTASFRALHGFISNESEFRLAVSEILKDGHVVRTVDSLMFYS